MTKHNSGWKKFIFFMESVNKNTSEWPIEIETVRSFVFWCLSAPNLKPCTVKAYLSSIKLAHELKGFSAKHLEKDTIIKMALTGSENLELYKFSSKPAGRSVNINILIILGHRISTLDWNKESAFLDSFATCFFLRCTFR